MPEIQVTDVTEIDFSKLISYTMSFEPLQLIFKNVMQRLNDMESAKEQHENEIAELKRSIEELRSQEKETPGVSKEEPPLQPKHATQEVVMSEVKKDTVVHPETKRAATPAQEPVDLHDLWEEVNRLKKIVGQVPTTDRRHTIEELYAARRRKDSTSVPRGPTPPAQDDPRHPSTPSTSEADVKVGDIILDRAREHLPLATAEVRFALPPAPGRAGSEAAEAATGEAVEPARRAEAPLPGVAGTMPFRVLSAAGQGGGEERDPLHVSSADSGAPSSRNGRLVSCSITERLRADGSDIEHLNRVVAEMLNEMKGLHADVDSMRKENTIQSTAMSDTDSDDLYRRIAALEDAVNRLQPTALLGPSGTAQLERTTATKPPQPIDTDLLRRLPGALDELRRLAERLSALERAQERTNEKFSALSGAVAGGDGTPFQEALFTASLAAVERQLAELQGMGLRNCDADIAALQKAVEKMQSDIAALEEWCRRLPLQPQMQPQHEKEREREKEEREPSYASLPLEPSTSGVPSAGAVSAGLPDFAAGDGGVAKDYEAAIQELQRYTEELSRRLVEAEGGVKYLDEEKADRATLQRLNDDLQQLRRLLEINAASRGDGDATGVTTSMQEDLLNMQKQLADQLRESDKIRDTAITDLDALREYVEKIDNCKADAALVANKAERDYVENALERLMREVEQVLNATNAGLIDTLDRSLNVLRDMLDGKATKQDMAQLQRIMAEESSGAGAPDALTGFKGFRCLGCNRPVDTMRPRPLGNRLQPFVNRLPQGHSNDATARIQQGPSGGATDEAQSKTAV